MHEDKYEYMIDDNEVICILHNEDGDFVGSVKTKTLNLEEDLIKSLKWLTARKAEVSHAVKMTEILNTAFKNETESFKEYYDSFSEKIKGIAEINNSYMNKYFELTEAIASELEELSEKIDID